MISKYSYFLERGTLEHYFGVDRDHVPQYSYHQHQDKLCAIITQDKPTSLQSCQWGLVPHWSKANTKAKHLINADCEGISTKTSFRIPFRQRRCIIPADSFYAYINKSVPHRLQIHKQKQLAIAGIYDDWQNLRSFAMITRRTKSGLLGVLPSIPIVLEQSQIATWLHEDTPLKDLLDIVQHSNKENVITYYPITDKISNTFYNQADLHQEVKIEQTLFQ